MLAAVFKDTITLGSLIVAALVGLGGLAVFFYGVRWKTAYLVAEANAEAWHKTAERLEEEMKSLREQVQVLRARVAELETLPDVSHVLKAVIDHDKAQGESWRLHNTEANGRADRIVNAIRELKPKGVM